MNANGIIPELQLVGWTLLHFVWQGTVIALLLMIILRCLRSCSANARYVTACGALLLMVMAPLLTLRHLMRTEQREGVLMPGVVAVPATETARVTPMSSNVAGPVTDGLEVTKQSVAGQIEALLPWLVIVWFVIVMLLSLRLFAGWLQLRRLRLTATQLDGEFWNEMRARMSQRLYVRRPIKLLKSAWLEVPAVIGWLRPVILFPASSLSGLTLEQLETILAHEFAHIRRHDYLVNLLQSVVETLLFYHPAVWWVSAKIREEREHCCDDLAVQVCGNSLTYAQALAKLEQLRATPVQLGVAIGGGSLLARIRRLVGTPPEASTSASWSAAAFAAIVLLFGASGLLQLTSSAADRREKMRPKVQSSEALQVEIKASFAEISPDEAKALGLDWFLNSTVGAAPQKVATVTALEMNPQHREWLSNTTHVVGSVVGILTEAQNKAIIRKLKARSGVNLLSSPKVTTLSGRQALIDVTEQKTVVVRKIKDDTFETAQIRVGSRLDVTPSVSEDGSSIQLTLTAQLLEFVGYDDPRTVAAANASDPNSAVETVPLPRFRNRQTTTKMVVPSGQTLVLAGMPTEHSVKENSKTPKHLIIFVTPSVPGSTGNRLPQ